jgi:hypothetical protein
MQCFEGSRSLLQERDISTRCVKDKPDSCIYCVVYDHLFNLHELYLKALPQHLLAEAEENYETGPRSEIAAFRMRSKRAGHAAVTFACRN